MNVSDTGDQLPENAGIDERGDSEESSAFGEFTGYDDDFADLPPIHHRTYDVRAWRRSESRIVVRGRVIDDKPPDLYIAGDPDVLTIHHMVVDLEVTFPALEIVAARVNFAAFPHELCPTIIARYDQLVGLSIARGFTHRVRELFGGPRGCTHTTALLQAMAPVAVQCSWSMRIYAGRERHQAGKPPVAMTEAQKALFVGGNINTCHIWDEEGDHVRDVRAGNFNGIPINIRRRLDELGRDPKEWLISRGG